MILKNLWYCTIRLGGGETVFNREYVINMTCRPSSLVDELYSHKTDSNLVFSRYKIYSLDMILTKRWAYLIIAVQL